MQYYRYEDKAFSFFPPRSHFAPALTNRTNQLKEWQMIQNESMTSLLCTLEWTFGRNFLFFLVL